jgi:hypothetical protein
VIPQRSSGYTCIQKVINQRIRVCPSPETSPTAASRDDHGPRPADRGALNTSYQDQIATNECLRLQGIARRSQSCWRYS